MTAALRLSLAAPRGHALAEGLRLAFAARGSDLDLVPVQTAAPLLAEGAPRLTIRRGAEPPVILRDPLALFDLAEDLHPDQPLHPRDPVRRAEHRQALVHLPAIATLVDRLTLATDARDVDLHSHLIRAELGQLAPVLSRERGGLSLLDLAALPVLWRLDALDRSFETHLLTGHEPLRDRQASLSGRWPALLSSELLADWLAWIIAHAALITRPESRSDWSTALGPSEPENALPRQSQRTKVHSIGSHGVLR